MHTMFWLCVSGSKDRASSTDWSRWCHCISCYWLYKEAERVPSQVE